MKIMYAITHVSDDYGRHLTFANQGRNHYETRKKAETAMRLLKPSLREKVLGDKADTLKVLPIECYDHGDAVRSVFLRAVRKRRRR